MRRSITEFWRRWHISLSTWLRDYLYIPLGGNRKGAARTYVNLAIGDAARRALARRGVEFRDLGEHPRPDAGFERPRARTACTDIFPGRCGRRSRS